MLSVKNRSRIHVWAATIACVFVTAMYRTAAGQGTMLPRSHGHPLVSGHLPPGVVGNTRLQSRLPVAGYFQPIKFSGPKGTQFALPQGGVMSPAESDLMAGLLIGNVYRFKITGIPGAPGAELFPTLELIDRTYPPPGLATSFPIPINLDEVDLEEALAGRMVTRVVYLEDQQSAAPLPTRPDNPHALDVEYHQDPLETADRLGRPLAIVRIGSLAPPSSPQLLAPFYFGYPTWAPIFQPETDGGTTDLPADAYVPAPDESAMQ